MSKEVDQSKAKKAKISKISKNPVVKAGEYQIHDFINFIRTQGVVGLAVGLALGGAITIMVRSFIDNIFMPPIGLIMGSADGLVGLKLMIGRTSNGEPTYIDYGVFINDFINFIVIAFVIYLIVRVLKVSDFDVKKP